MKIKTFLFGEDPLLSLQLRRTLDDGVDEGHLEDEASDMSPAAGGGPPEAAAAGRATDRQTGKNWRPP